MSRIFKSGIFKDILKYYIYFFKDRKHGYFNTYLKYISSPLNLDFLKDI